MTETHVHPRGLDHGGHTAPARVYVASSWRNGFQPTVVTMLRVSGISVYDFRNPPNKTGFGWEQIDRDWQQWTPREYVNALEHRLASEGFQSDLDALRSCYVCVLVQPCGRSAHLELGYAAAMGKRCAVLQQPGQEPELMLKVAEYFTESIHELVHWVANLKGL